MTWLWWIAGAWVAVDVLFVGWRVYATRDKRG